MRCFGDARAIEELVRYRSSSVLWARTEALEKLQAEIFFVDRAEYLVSLLRDKVRRTAVERLGKLNPRALSIWADPVAALLRDMHWRVQ